MAQNLTAFIDESNCIGCSKCIRVCPTDAIVGAKHVLHTIIPKFCTSCEDCINACPTECISLKTPHKAMSPIQEKALKHQKQSRLLSAKAQVVTVQDAAVSTFTPTQADDRKQHIADAIARVKARKNLAQNKF